MKRMLMAIIAVAVAVTFNAPSFAAGEKKDEKKGGKFVQMINAEEKKDKGGKADETFGEKKEEKKGK
jgi:Ni/Co efflux regulator RcnB